MTTSGLPEKLGNLTWVIAPARQRLAKAVADGKITQARADAVLERLEDAAHRLAGHLFPK